MASRICFQRSGGCPGFFACARVPGVSAVKGDDPGGPGGLVAFAGGAMLESIFGANVPGTPVGLATTVAAESLATDLASESAGSAGVDFIDTVSWAGGGGGVTTSFGGAGAGDGAGAFEAGTSLLATRLEVSGGNSAR
jgi:hypothetical protein